MFFRGYPIFLLFFVILRFAVRHFTNEVMLLAGSKKRSNELPNHPNFIPFTKHHIKLVIVMKMYHYTVSHVMHFI